MSPQNNIFGKIPFLRYVVAFILGILIGGEIKFQPILLFSCIVLIACTFLLKIAQKKKTSFKLPVFNYLTPLLFISFGTIYSSYYQQTIFSKKIPEYGTYIGTILEKAPSTRNRFKYSLKIESVKDSTSIILLDEKIVAYISDSISNEILKPGNKIQFRTKLYQITNSNNPGEFNFQRYMFLKKVRYQSYLKYQPEILPTKSNKLTTIALNCRTKLLKKYLDAGIEEQEFAVLAALTLGEKNYLSNELKSSFAASGAMHVLAVSGLHVGIIYLILNMLFKSLNKSKYSRTIKVICIIVLLWIYAFITGLSPSVLRSSTMFSLIVIGGNLNRKTNIYNTLATSAFILLLYDPYIIYQVGFQLSYAAVLSIVFFQPKIASLLNTENPLINWLWNLLAVSIAAQIGTFPISIYYFHQFPTYFWISNFIVIPAAAFLLYSSFLFFSTLFIPFLSKSIAWLISFGIKGMNFGISSIESLPGAVIENIWMNEMSLIIYLLLILSIANLTVNKKFCNIYPSLFLLILLIINTSIQTYTIRTQKVIIFYNNYSEDLISFIDGNSHYYYSISDSISSNSQRLLKNSSRYYSTQNSIALNKRMKNQNDLRIYRNSIFFKNCIVRLENVNSKYINSTTNDEIIWIPHNSTLIIKENNLFELWILKNSKLKKMTQNEGKIKYKTHNNSALTATIN